MRKKELNLDQTILTASKTHLFFIGYLQHRAGSRPYAGKLLLAGLMVIRQKAPKDPLLAVHEIEAGFVQRDRIGRCKNADVGNERDVVPRRTIAVRRDVCQEVDVKHLPGFIADRSRRVLDHPFDEHDAVILPVEVDRMFRAGVHAHQTAYTVAKIDRNGPEDAIAEIFQPLPAFEVGNADAKQYRNSIHLYGR